MTYSQKLRDPRWQRKRLEILQRDGFKCLSCGCDTKELQVHHVVYRRLDPWDYPDCCYQTLCSDCHHERQSITDSLVDAIRLKLKDVPTGRIKVVANRMYSDALQSMEVSQ